MNLSQTTQFKAEALSWDTLRHRAPSIFAPGPMQGVSDRYAFVPTARIVAGLRETNWVPVDVEEQRIRQEKRRKSRSHAEVFLKYPLIAFVVCLMIVLVSMNKLGLYTYPMVILVYGMWLFVSGGVIRFKPLLVGGIINWVLAIVSLSVGFSTQLLLLALAVLLGYIIPGHWLKMERNRIADPA